MSVKLATYLLIRGGISKEAMGARCWTAPGSLENPRFLQLMLAQCSNTPGLTPHCLAPEVNSIKHKQKVSVKHCLFWIRGLESPCCSGGSDGRHWKTRERPQTSPQCSQETCRAVLVWTHQDMCQEACKRFLLWCGALEMLKAQRVGHAHAITPCKQLSDRPSNIKTLPGRETPL